MKQARTPLLVAPRWTQYLQEQDFATWLFENDKDSARKEGDGQQRV
jgi:hypothetical protein